MTKSTTLRTFYPGIEPFDQGFLKLSAPHIMYWERCGNPDGIPVVFIHGGPGGGCSEDDRRFFDPQKYHIILFDQRGCGRSTPFAELADNTTGHLVADIEKLRASLGIEKWLVFGGSWGSTLALAYAQAHPNHVTGLVLRGIFIGRKKEISWFYQEGASRLFPDAHETFRNFIPASERDSLVHAYHRRLNGHDEEQKLEAARRWSTWEMATSRLIPDPEKIARGGDAHFALPFARIESHFFVNDLFMPEGELLKRENIIRIAHIPTVIMHGRYDVVCPVESAYDLKRALPAAQLLVTPDAGHASSEPGNLHNLIRATDGFDGSRFAALG